MNLFRRNPRRLPGTLCDETADADLMVPQEQRGKWVVRGDSPPGGFLPMPDLTDEQMAALQARFDEAHAGLRPLPTRRIPVHEVPEPRDNSEYDPRDELIIDPRDGDVIGFIPAPSQLTPEQVADLNRRFIAEQQKPARHPDSGYTRRPLPAREADPLGIVDLRPTDPKASASDVLRDYIATLEEQLADRTRELEDECRINADLRKQLEARGA